jgi:hypothetical protein
MQEECSTLSGRIAGSPSLNALSAALLAAALPAELRESAQFTGGSYLRLDAGNATASFERDGTEISIRADARSAGALLVLAQSLDRALSEAKLRHRLELYSGNLQVGYLHYDWPEES